MPNIQQVAELLLQTSGTEAVAALTEALDANQEKIDQLVAAYATGNVTFAAHAAALGKLATEQKSLTSILDAMNRSMAAEAAAADAAEAAIYDLADAYDLADREADQATRTSVMYAAALRDDSESIADMEARTRRATIATDAMGDAKHKATSAMRGATGAVLELSRGIEDLATGGPIGILNNVPGIVDRIGTAFKMSSTTVAALTGGLSLAATGAFLLYQHWDKLKDLFDVGIPKPVLDGTAELKKKLEEAEKTTEELGKKTRLTFEELDKYKKATESVKSLNDELKKRAELEGLLSAKSDAENERASGFKKALGESGDAATGELLDALKGRAGKDGKVYDVSTGMTGTPESVMGNLIRAAAGGGLTERNEISELTRGMFGAKSRFANNIEKFSPETAKKMADNAADAKKAVEDEKRFAAERSAEIDANKAAQTKAFAFDNELWAAGRKTDAEAAKKLADSKKANEARRKHDEALAERDKAQRAEVDKEIGSVAGDLMKQGHTPGDALKVAEEASYLHRNFGIPLAQAQNQALQAAVQGLSAVKMEYARLRQQTAILQSALNRTRTMQPTTQPVPFATP